MGAPSRQPSPSRRYYQTKPRVQAGTSPLKDNMGQCSICKKEIVLSPSAAERAAKDSSGKTARDYTRMFTEHADCAIEKREAETRALIEKHYRPAPVFTDSRGVPTLYAFQCGHVYERVGLTMLLENREIALWSFKGFGIWEQFEGSRRGALVAFHRLCEDKASPTPTAP